MAKKTLVYIPPLERARESWENALYELTLGLQSIDAEDWRSVRYFFKCSQQSMSDAAAWALAHTQPTYHDRQLAASDE